MAGRCAVLARQRTGRVEDGGSVARDGTAGVGVHVSCASAWWSGWRGVAGAAGGVQGPGDLRVGQAGLAGGVGELAQVGGGVSVQGAVGGPEQAGVAVAFGLGGDPAGQAGQVPAGGLGLAAGRWGWGWGCRSAGDGGPVQAAAAAGLPDELVGLAVDLGGRGQDVAACRAEVQVVGGQVAVALVGAGEVGVQAAAGGADVGGRAVQQPGVCGAGGRRGTRSRPGRGRRRPGRRGRGRRWRWPGSSPGGGRTSR